MKIIQVKKVPSRAHRQVQGNRVFWTFYKPKYLFVYEPYVNCHGERVFIRETYHLVNKKPTSKG